ncbi:NADP-dependent oxidoreductase [Podosphaera aphanis]|nr:NADP-dependent oxidoreductase [Podosphaera aphanis]
MAQNKGLIFKQIPSGYPVPGQDLTVEARDFDLQQTPPAGGLLTKNLYASFDPYQRGRMSENGLPAYLDRFKIGYPITSLSIAKVLKSLDSRFKEGDFVYGMLPVEEYSVVKKEEGIDFQLIENPHNFELPIFLGALGMPGLTAYGSLYEIGKPVRNETIFISSAAGAVGQLVGQLAKHEGLKVIGSVGTDEKLHYITKDLKFDGGFNYKEEKSLDALRRLAPEGIDIYYDNVGGEQLDAALDVMNTHGRIVCCGMISDYNKDPDERYPVRNIIYLVAKQITMRGFLVSNPEIGVKYFKARNENISKWLQDGSFQVKSHVTAGIENGPEGFVGMLKGKNFGRAVLKIADE